MAPNLQAGAVGRRRLPLGVGFAGGAGNRSGWGLEGGRCLLGK